MSKKVYLRNIDQWAIVDNEDFKRVRKYSWHGYKQEKENYYYARMSYRNKTGSMNAQLHRFVLNEQDPKVCITFRNRNRLDCRKKNLVRVDRVALRGVCGKHKNSQSKYKGIMPMRDGRYEAFISHHGKQFYLGAYDTQEFAALAYDQKLKQFKGELALLNFPNATQADYDAVKRSKLPYCGKHKRACNNTSDYIGVSHLDYYTAKIWHKGKLIYIGKFDDELEAAHAWDKKARELRGERAITNFPLEAAD